MAADKLTAADKLKAKASKKLNKAKELANKASSWLTETDMFKKGCDDVFDMVDIDNSGTVDDKELYSAVLLVYLKLAKVVKGLTPPTPKQVKELLDQVDSDASGELHKEVGY